MRHIVQNTYAMVAFIDHCVGRIIETVDRRGLADDTIVCFTSDHGDLLGDHGLLYKGQIPFASLLRMPFIVRAPGIQPAVVAAPMNSADAMPTLMDLAGLPAAATVQGLSYARVLTGEVERIRDAAFSCGWSKESAQYRHMSLHNEQWRVTRWPGLQQGELYDLRADPHELENVYYLDEYLPERDWLMEKLLNAYAEAGPLEPHVLGNW